MPTVYDNSCFEVSGDYRVYSMFIKEEGDSPLLEISRNSSLAYDECYIGRIIKAIK